MNKRKEIIEITANINTKNNPPRHTKVFLQTEGRESFQIVPIEVALI